jgi:hypothetical protein
MKYTQSEKMEIIRMVEESSEVLPGDRLAHD